ncbi:MAG: hypothetical protein JWN30_288 [Bacilli bacterium]|nr:hypothetical protein [Bacilli bacterium]
MYGCLENSWDSLKYAFVLYDEAMPVPGPFAFFYDTMNLDQAKLWQYIMDIYSIWD